MASVSQQSGVDTQNTPEPEQEQFVFTDSIDREAIAAFINRTTLITYEIKPFKTTDYLPSLIKLTISKLKESGEYDALAAEVKKLNLSWKVFDTFGKAVNADKAGFLGKGRD